MICVLILCCLLVALMALPLLEVAAAIAIAIILIKVMYQLIGKVFKSKKKD